MVVINRSAVRPAPQQSFFGAAIRENGGAIWDSRQVTDRFKLWLEIIVRFSGTTTSN